MVALVPPGCGQGIDHDRARGPSPPSSAGGPTTNVADSPSGLEVDLEIPQSEDPLGTATAHLKDTVVTLPEGLNVNPASANGLDACSSAQIGLTSAPGVTPITYTPAAANCPNASKLGTVEVDTPLLDHPVPARSTSPSPTTTPSTPCWRSTSRSTIPRAAASPRSPARFAPTRSPAS